MSTEKDKKQKSKPLLSQPSVKEVVYGEIRHFEDLVKDSLNFNDSCRNGLRVSEHPPVSMHDLLDLQNQENFADGLKSLQRESNRMHKSLIKTTNNAVDYIKAARCIQRTGMSQLNKQKQSAI